MLVKYFLPFDLHAPIMPCIKNLQKLDKLNENFSIKSLLK